MKLGDKVRIIKGKFIDRKAVVVKAFTAKHITNIGEVNVVCVSLLPEGTSLIIKQEHVKEI